MTEINWNQLASEYLPFFEEGLSKTGVEIKRTPDGLMEFYRNGVLHTAEHCVALQLHFAEKCVELGLLTLFDIERNKELQVFTRTLSLMGIRYGDGAYADVEFIDCYVSAYEDVFHSSEPASAGYIYLIQAVIPTTYYKIGLTKSPIDRIRTLGVQLPFPIKVLHLIKTNHMKKAERELHEEFASKRVNGEWFELADEDVASILNRIEIAVLGAKLEFPKDES